MKRFLRLITIVCIAAAVLLGTPAVMPQQACELGFAAEAEAATVKLSKTKLEMYDDTTANLKVKGTNKSVSWESSNRNVAMVLSSGNVYAMKPGTATVTAKVNGKTYKCKVIVKAVPKLNLTKKTVYTGTKTQLKLNGYKIGKVKWTTSNKKVATVSSKGVVTAKKAGSAHIYAKVGGETLTFEATVKTAPKLNLTKKTVYTGTKTQLKLNGYKIGKVKWTTSNKKVAAVSSKGLVTAKKAGTATIKATVGGKALSFKVTVKALPTLNKEKITVTVGEKVNIKINGYIIGTPKWSFSEPDICSRSSNGTITANSKGMTSVIVKIGSHKMYCDVIVKGPRIDSLELNKTSLALVIGETYNLDAIIYPETASGEMVYWKSSNTNVAGVGTFSGLVRAYGEGTATITAYTDNGVKAICKVSVDKIPVERIELSKSELRIDLWKTTTAYLDETVYPENASMKSVKWSSSDTSVATVSTSGTITALKEGTVTITATADGKSAKCVVTIGPKTLKTGDTWTLENKWRLRINSVEKHNFCNSYSSAKGKQVVIIDYTYWCDGYDDVTFDFLDMDLFDAKNVEAELYPCTHTGFPAYISRGESHTTQEAFVLKNSSDVVKLTVEKSGYEIEYSLDLNAVSEPEDSENAGGESQADQNKATLKEELKKYGTYGQTSSGSAKYTYSKNWTTIGSSLTFTSKIIYYPASDYLEFSLDSSDSSRSILMALDAEDILGIAEGKAYIEFVGTKMGSSGIGMAAADFSVVPADYDPDIQYAFKLNDNMCWQVTNSQVQTEANKYLDFAVTSWQELLASNTHSQLLTLNKLGFSKLD